MSVMGWSGTAAEYVQDRINREKRQAEIRSLENFRIHPTLGCSYASIIQGFRELGMTKMADIFVQELADRRSASRPWRARRAEMLRFHRSFRAKPAAKL
ncbi:MAG: hypothetical protein QOJ84_3768 [Bradyrhizobium sp.]|nr:hypothetical protein [Bradyrhizobium sp.]